MVNNGAMVPPEVPLPMEIVQEMNFTDAQNGDGFQRPVALIRKISEMFS